MTFFTLIISFRELAIFPISNFKTCILYFPWGISRAIKPLATGRTLTVQTVITVSFMPSHITGNSTIYSPCLFRLVSKKKHQTPHYEGNSPSSCGSNVFMSAKYDVFPPLSCANPVFRFRMFSDTRIEALPGSLDYNEHRTVPMREWRWRQVHQNMRYRHHRRGAFDNKIMKGPQTISTQQHMQGVLLFHDLTLSDG